MAGLKPVEVASVIAEVTEHGTRTNDRFVQTVLDALDAPTVKPGQFDVPIHPKARFRPWISRNQRHLRLLLSEEPTGGARESSCNFCFVDTTFTNDNRGLLAVFGTIDYGDGSKPEEAELQSPLYLVVATARGLFVVDFDAHPTSEKKPEQYRADLHTYVMSRTRFASKRFARRTA